MFKSVCQRLSSSSIVIRERLSILSKYDLGIRMKQLNDQQRYKDALDLFNKHQHLINDQSINQALKACTKEKDYRRGMAIHEQLSSNSLNNRFLLSSLIYFYSKLEN